MRSSRRAISSWHGPGFGRKEWSVIQHARLQRGLQLAAEVRAGVDLRESGGMVDPVEAFGNIGVEPIVGCMAQGREHGFDRIVTGSAWAKAIAVGFKAGFPFGFERRLDQGLARTIRHDGDASRPLRGALGFGNPNPASRLGLLPKPQGLRECQALAWCEGLHPIDAGSRLAMMLLAHLPYGEQSCRPRFQQQTLKRGPCCDIATTRGSVEALLQ